MIIGTPLHPKMIVLPPRFFRPKTIVQFISWAKNLRLKVQYFRAKPSSSKNSFDTATSGGVSEQLLFFYTIKVTLTTTRRSMVALISLISPKLRTQTNRFRTEGVHIKPQMQQNLHYILLNPHNPLMLEEYLTY
jgi:hypothetical protein